MSIAQVRTSSILQGLIEDGSSDHRRAEEKRSPNQGCFDEICLRRENSQNEREAGHVSETASHRVPIFN